MAIKGWGIDMTNIHQFEPLWGVWKIEEELGEGSYGKVYKAVRNEFGATYYAAIKHISIPINQTEIRNLYEEGLAADEGSARRYYERMLANLLQEIRLMSALKGHTNIVAYEDHMTIEKRDMPGYDVFIRMELLKGLYEHARSTKFTVLDVCNLGIDICTALEILQKKNIVHRDIKPANILYSDDGNYKLSDFGVARTLEHNATVMSKKGTYAYMAPEVYGGQPASFNSDVYSLGLVMHRLLNNNRAPFLPTDGSTVTYEQNEEALMRRMGGEAIPYPVNADQSMATLLAIACDFKPEYRFQDAGQFKEALLSYRQDIAPNQYAVIREGEGVPSERSASNKANMTAKELRQKKAEIERQKKELERQERELAEAAEVERREAEEAAKEQERVRKAEEKQRRKTEEKRKAGEKEPKKSKAAAIIAVAAAAIIIACVLALSLGKDKPNDNIEASVLTTTPVIVTAGEPAIEPRPLNAESIKASNHHTVGLRSDGTVVAAGSNSYGQCNVDEWSNIARIAAGAHHTVGLKKNGTVVAAGSNSYGQCNVNGWNNIAEIATGAYHTVGLKKDGTVVATGSNNDGECNISEWTDIVAIAAGPRFALGLKSDGTVVAAGNNEYGQCNVESWNIKADSDASTVQNTEVRLSVDNSIKRSDTASTMTVNGTMETGASISVSGVELEGAVTQDSNAGTFSFTVKTANVGVYEAVITATKGDAVRTSTVYLEHQPDRDSYMKGVYKMNYNNIKQYPTHKQGYKIVGKVTEVIQSTPYVKARIQTSDGDMIFCYYSGVAAIEARDGKTYELYGDPYGTDDASGLPQLHAWFILKRSGEPN